MPVGASLVGLVIAGYSALLIIQSWSGVPPADIPKPHRAVLGALLRKPVPDQKRRAGRGGLAVAVLVIGVFGLIGLSIPLQFVANPAWVAANGLNGQLSGLLCLFAFLVWTAYALIVFGRASRSPVAASPIESDATASEPPATAARFIVRSPLTPQECVQAIREHLRDAVRRETGEGRLRDCEIAETSDGSLLVTFLHWSMGYPMEKQRPGRVQAWLYAQPLDAGASVQLSLATRTQFDRFLARGWIPAAILACFSIAILFPYVATPFAIVGVVVSMSYVAIVVASQLVRPRLIRECRLCVRSVCAVLQGVAEIDSYGSRRNPLAAWNEVRSDDI